MFSTCLLSRFLFSIRRRLDSRFSFLSPAPSSSRSPPRDTRRSTGSNAITTFIRQVFRTTDRRRWKRNECKTRPVERISSRVVPIRDEEGGRIGEGTVSHGGKGECISMESDAENPTRRWTWDRTRKEGSDRACKSRVYRARPITTVVPYETIRVPPKISVALYLRNKPDRDLSRYRFIASGTDDSPRERGGGNRRGSTTHRIEEKRGSRRIEEDRN